MSHPIYSPRKLIEVALPLDAINAEAARRKRKAPAGYPTTLHKWWAQRPVAAARAVLFSQMVNDPGYQHGAGFTHGKNKAAAAEERKRLFKIIEELVLWDNTRNEGVLDRAKAEIERSWREVCALNRDHPQARELFNPDCLPVFQDPFAGSGAIPLEAQRLGLRAFASDLNPVAVLINKATIEFPPVFAGRPPVAATSAAATGRRLALPGQYPAAAGLAEDVRRYANWIKGEAYARIGHLYPSIKITQQMAKAQRELAPLVGKELGVIAWLWARTVASPSPAFRDVQVPLASTFVLSAKAAGRPGEQTYVHPVVDGSAYHFTVRTGALPPAASAGTSAGRRAAFLCLLSDVPIDYVHIRAEGKAGRLGQRLMAVVAEKPGGGRVFIAPSSEMEALAASAQPSWMPDIALPNNTRDFKTPLYGFGTFGSLFTSRQLVSLATLSDLIKEVKAIVVSDALRAGMQDDALSLEQGGSGASAYADAVAVYLAFALSRAADYGCANATWRPKDNAMRSALAKQALPMTWDFAEGNPFGESSAGFAECADVVARALEESLAPAGALSGIASQTDAAGPDAGVDPPPFIVSTDPPYYDNIGYADLSDFFYGWLRRTLRETFPRLFATVNVPKADELVAAPYRHGSEENAQAFFLDGMTRAMRQLASRSHPAFPVTIYYAVRESETEASGTSSTGWETFLAAVIAAGFCISGTWPVRTESDNKILAVGGNALASSVVLVCRRRSLDSPSVSRRDFIRELAVVLPNALDEMTKGAGDDRSPVAPVDLSQAIIGPGMAVFSKYAAVLEADGSPMSVRTALQLINRFLAEDDFDADTQFCLRWFEQCGWKAGKFGDADTLARAKGTAVDGVKAAGVVESGGGSVRLLKWAEYATSWDPSTDARNPVWETLHHLIRALKQDGESAAGRLLALVKDKAEPARQLAYRLYTLCERQGWAEDARAYNELITSWSGIEAAASAAPSAPTQGKLFD